MLMETNDMELYLSNLKDNIRNLFCEVTCTKYIGDLDLVITDYCNDRIYTLKMGLNCPDVSPVVLGFQGNEEQFMKYLAKEFRKRRLHEVEYTEANLINGDYDWHIPIIEI